jgi:hypothetical protein
MSSHAENISHSRSEQLRRFGADVEPPHALGVAGSAGGVDHAGDHPSHGFRSWREACDQIFPQQCVHWRAANLVGLPVGGGDLRRRRHDKERHLRRHRRSDFRQEIVFRHHQVEDHDIGPRFANAVERQLAVRGLDDFPVRIGEGRRDERKLISEAVRGIYPGRFLNRTALRPVAALDSAAVVSHRQLNLPGRASNEWLRAEIQRAAASCTDAVTVRHLRAIITALSR